jgi:hypothetical protein
MENIKIEDGGSMFPGNIGNTGHFHMVPTPKNRIKIIIKKSIITLNPLLLPPELLRNSTRIRGPVELIEGGRSRPQSFGRDTQSSST